MEKQNNCFEGDSIHFEKEDNRYNENDCTGGDSQKFVTVYQTDKTQQTEVSVIMGEIIEMEKLLRFHETCVVHIRKCLFDLGERLTAGLLEHMDYLKFDLNAYKKKILQYEKELYHLELLYEKEVLILKIPAILPHRTTRPAISFEDAVLDEMDAFISDHPDDYQRIKSALKKKATLVIEHSYEKKYMVRDNDNVEIKRVTDLFVVSGFLPGDDGLILNIFHTAKLVPGNKCETVLMLMTNERFKQMITEQAAGR